jgi:flagellar hook-associated protein 2
MTASITSLGIGSGVDVNTIVTQLVALESRPIGQLRSQAGQLQTQVSSYGQLSSLFGALQTAANKLSGSGLWSASRASSSNDAAVQVVGGSNATPGSYNVEVTRLAAQQTVVATTRLPGATAPVGSGVMTLDIGQWDDPPMNFVPQVGRDPVSIVVTTEDTLATLRDKINGAGAGVTASIVNDSGGARLALRATDSGVDRAFRLSVADDDGPNPADGTGLSRFAFDPENGSVGMRQEVAGSNADATVNGIQVLSRSNELEGVVDGMTLRLRQQGASADIGVVSDRDAVKTAIQDFATAYNNLAKAIADQTRFDPASKTGGPLQGDSAATGLQRQLRSLLGAGSLASSTFQRLSDVGLSLQRDGTLSVDAAKLDRASTNLPELKKAFANSDPDPQRDGFARRYADLAQRVLGIDGSLTTRTEGLRQRITDNQEAQTALQERVERFRARLVAQYTAMDGNVARLNALSSYVSQQLAALGNNNSDRR